MVRRYKPKSTRIDYGPVLILGAMFIASVLMMTCVLSVMLLNRLREPRPILQQDIPAIFPPTASLPTAMPANHFSIQLPMILYELVSVPEPIWKVTEMNNLGYELDGQRYDLATFTRIDGQDTVKAYCINRGWDIPEIGTEYLLGEEGIFVPLHEPNAQSIQRFLMLR